MKNARTSGAAAKEPAALRVSLTACLAAAGILAALWLFDLYVLRTPVLTPFVGAGVKVQALTPIYAFGSPAITARAAWFVAASLGFVAIAVRLCRVERTSARTFVAASIALGIVLPVSLFVLRQGLAELGTQFLIYPNEEVYFDALAIDDLRAFLAHYVERMPALSLHGRHFPPGHAVLLYVVGQGFGTSPLAAGIAVLACFALALPFVYRALAGMHGDVAARQGVLLLLASPSVLDFACTSMDALLLLPAGVALWLATRSLASLGCDSPRRFLAPALTGCALFVATCFSFSTFPLGLAIGVAIVLAGRRSQTVAPRRVIESLATIGASYAATAALLYLATDFAMWSCLAEAKRSNFEFMSRVIGRHAHDLYGYLAYGNGAAFLIGSGVGIVAAAYTGRAVWRNPWSTAFALTLLVMVFGGIYFMETERIWLFAIPWLVAIAISRGPFTSGSLRLLLAVGLIQALVMETLLFTLW